ncbi:unnamed protein product, partial [Didymodactylos carnosus]
MLTLFYFRILALPVSSQATLCPSATWNPDAVTVVGGYGTAMNQLNSPWDIAID